MFLTNKKWSSLENRLIRKLKDDNFLKNLNDNDDLKAYYSPSGRITYNKIVGKNNFGQFTNLISAIIPLEHVFNEDNNDKIPSIANVLRYNNINIYKSYLYINASMEEFLDYETEENQDNMEKVLNELDKLPQRTPLVGIIVFKSEAMQSAHAVAFITWKVGKKYNFAYYDSLSYKKAKSSYDYAERILITENFQRNINFKPLSKYCYHKTSEEFHCSQYVINAEYCYVYAVYFLFKWINHGKLLTDSSFKTIVESTYIVHPQNLSRANNKDSMIYRVIMMAFIVKCLLCYFGKLTKKDKVIISDSSEHIIQINKYLQEFKDKYGFHLIS